MILFPRASSTILRILMRNLHYFSIATGNSPLAIRNSQLQLATRKSQLASRKSQLAARNSQLATPQHAFFPHPNKKGMVFELF